VSYNRSHASLAEVAIGTMMPMSSKRSVTRWIDRLKAGNRAAAQRLWERYFKRLVAVARSQLRDTPRRAADEEDVALSAFNSFCRGAERGRFPELLDRNSLWRLLVTMTRTSSCGGGSISVCRRNWPAMGSHGEI
jgi:hypothetical protein